MESVACLNVDISKFLSTTKRTEVKWKCSDFVLKMLEEGILTDITIHGEGGSVKAHRTVLTCVCPVLLTKVLKDCVEECLSLYMPIDALKLFLLSLYTTNEDDDVEVPQLSVAIDKHFVDLYIAMRDCKVESRLGFVLLPALARNLNPRNCWLHYRDSLSAEHLEYKISSSEICYNYILGNYAEVIKSKNFPHEMKKNAEQAHRIMLHAQSEASRQLALQSFRERKRARIEAVTSECINKVISKVET